MHHPLLLISCALPAAGGMMLSRRAVATINVPPLEDDLHESHRRRARSRLGQALGITTALTAPALLYAMHVCELFPLNKTADATLELFFRENFVASPLMGGLFLVMSCVVGALAGRPTSFILFEALERKSPGDTRRATRRAAVFVWVLVAVLAAASLFVTHSLAAEDNERRELSLDERIKVLRDFPWYWPGHKAALEELARLEETRAYIQINGRPPPAVRDAERTELQRLRNKYVKY